MAVMLNEIRLDVGIENPPEITPGRYSSLIFRIRRVFEGNNRGKFLCGSRLGKKASYAPIWHFKLLRWVKSLINGMEGKEESIAQTTSTTLQKKTLS